MVSREPLQWDAPGRGRGVGTLLLATLRLCYDSGLSVSSGGWSRQSGALL